MSIKKSHKEILNLLTSGYWLKFNYPSFKKHAIFSDLQGGLKLVRTVRQSTVEEMRRVGLLVLDVSGQATTLVPSRSYLAICK